MNGVGQAPRERCLATLFRKRKTGETGGCPAPPPLADSLRHAEGQTKSTPEIGVNSIISSNSMLDIRAVKHELCPLKSSIAP